MPNKDRPLVDQHAPKNGVGWLMNVIEGKVCRFANDMATAHAQWVSVETRPLRGGGQLLSDACCATTPSKPGKRCRSQAGGSDAGLSGEDALLTGSRAANGFWFEPLNRPHQTEGL